MKRSLSDAVSRELRERAESVLDNAEPPSVDEDLSPAEMVRELRLQRIELELQNKELRRYRDELEASQERYSNLYFHAPVGHVTLDREGTINEINYLAAELLGANRESLLESSIFDHVDSESRQRLKTHTHELFDRPGVHQCELAVDLPTNTRVHLAMMSIAVDDPFDDESQWRAAIFDITDQKHEEAEKNQLQKKLHESHRMETLGRLARGIAHDFNNLLTLIIGYSKMAINRLPDDDPLSKHVVEINKAGRHAGELIEQLLAFSRSDGSSSGTIDVNERIEEMETMFDRLIGDDIELHLSLDNPLGTVQFDTSQFQQVLLNLVVNAREAITSGGHLFVRSRNVTIENQKAQSLELDPGSYVIVEVEDNGNGIPPDVVPHIFEPFFTTKSPDENHGCGLSTIYGIVRRHGGAIDVHTEPGDGSTFYVYLPRTDDRSDESSSQYRVLVVDDQPDLREFASLVLDDPNTEVISAPNPDEALQISRACGNSLDLVVTDVTMPGMSGPQLLAHIREFHPDAAVLYMSGYDRQSLQSEHGLAIEAPFLEKPFSPDDLQASVTRLLDDEG